MPHISGEAVLCLQSFFGFVLLYTSQFNHTLNWCARQHTHSAAPVISGVSQFSGAPVGGLHCCSHQTPHSSLLLAGSSSLVASHLPDGFALWASDDCCACEQVSSKNVRAAYK